MHILISRFSTSLLLTLSHCRTLIHTISYQTVPDILSGLKLVIGAALLHLHIKDFQHFTFQVKKENCLDFVSELKPSQLF